MAKPPGIGDTDDNPAWPDKVWLQDLLNHKFIEQEALIRAILESAPWRALDAHGRQDDGRIGVDAGATLDSQDVASRQIG
ncbi:hypothetical protein AK812_SmicGene9158 [Symbiodinium microadriaticum]|uniref:Uncharacterized protein n=1 Tax=Symbiodinium microadriaticum TaxID=2951 RepID=A0A1Q9EJ42_SYMMI|nr:hypothetical protein AK812_SmicGene9158 [Symbiodinium microadriaticum]